MARITIEDCIEKVQDRFKLVALASQRAKDINSGSIVTISNDKSEKATVIALREIAAGHVKISVLREELIRRLQTKSKIDPIDDENIDLEPDNTTENFDYIPSGSDLCITDDYSDLDDQIFVESDSEENADLLK